MRSQYLSKARRVVVKIGSRLLRESPVGRPAAIADEIAALRKERGLEATVVSSGAIALGMRVMGLAKRPDELPRLQATAAVGQGQLMQNWERAFGAHGIPVGQVLLTHDDVAERERFLSARHALRALHEFGAVPIINENDTVAVEEIKFGDNDRLAALACNLVSADALILLTDVDGLHDADPRAGGKRIPLVVDIDREAFPVAGGAAQGGVGTGGMASKVQAAKIAARSGVPTVVAPGGKPGVVREILEGGDLGTLFVPTSAKLASRKHWIAFAQRPSGAVIVDEGARKALAEHGKSLLPSGIIEVRGSFSMGEAISVVGGDGVEFARGLARYGSDEIDRIRGKRSTDIEQVLGYKYLDEVIHRDDLVLL
ncbi:MAG: glutamate 5-kinase [Deltaproteobacteria bacterium]|nr:glutamate 5-kinase [Deltaproteobacteria bacterium]